MMMRLLITCSNVWPFALLLLCGLQPHAALAQEVSRSPVQTIYRQGVPHTDKTGKVRFTYDPQKSFFPIADWGTPFDGMTYGHDVDWNVLKSAGYNTVWTWYKPAIPSLAQGIAHNMQVVLMGDTHTATEFQQIANATAYKNKLLGVMWKDEPSAQVPLHQQQATYNAFQSYRSMVHNYLPDLPVFVGDAPGFNNGSAAETWWETWAGSGELTAQDNYPIYPTTKSIGRESPGGLSESISRATHVVGEQKPVWAIIQAFESKDPDHAMFPWRFPTPAQMRAQVYTAIVHGATGISYFAWDTYISRQPDLIGIAPNPLADGYVAPGTGGPYQATATPEQIQKSAALWNAVSDINAELQDLAPSIFSPTVDSTDLTYTPQIRNLSAPNDPTKFSNTPIRTLLKHTPDGNYVLFAVNMDDRSMDVDFSFSNDLQNFELLYEDDGGYFDSLGTASEFTYHFAPYATHIISFSASTPTSLLGDFDGNQVVDAADYVLWRKANIDGQNGYETWRQNFGNAITLSNVQSSAVPEPATGLLTLVYVAVFAAFSRFKG